MSDIIVLALFRDCGLIMQNSAHIIQQRPPSPEYFSVEVIGDDRFSVQKTGMHPATSTGE